MPKYRVLFVTNLALGIMSPGMNPRVLFPGHTVGPPCVHHVGGVGGETITFDI